MAVIKIWQVKKSLDKAVSYISKPEKTNNRVLISSNCGMPTDPHSVFRGMAYTQNRAENNRKTGRKGSVLAHHIVQSFSPGETDAAAAHEIGLEFVKEILGGEYAYCIATHVDTNHVHNHIIFSPINLKTLKKYRMGRARAREYKMISNRLCARAGLSTVDLKKRSEKTPGTHKTLAETYMSGCGRLGKDRLTLALDTCIKASSTWQEFKTGLEKQGIKISFKGANIVFNAPGFLPRPLRGKTLGSGYTEAAIMARLGRNSVNEYTLARKMVEETDTGKYRIFIPGGHKKYFTVPADFLLNHGTHYRLFLPENMSITVLNRTGRYTGRLNPGALYGFFARPPLSPARTPQAADTPVLGAKSPRHAAYLQALERNTREFKNRLAAENIYIRYLQAPEGFSQRLEKEKQENLHRLQRLIVEKQKETDTGRPTDLTEIKIRNLEKEIQAQEKAQAKIRFTEQQRRKGKER